MTGTDTDSRLDEQRLELLRRRLSQRGLASQESPGEHADGLPDGRLRMWFAAQADPTGAMLNVCVSYRVCGDVDVSKLHDAVDAVALRHDALRTTYATDENGEPRAVVHADLRPGWAEYDLADLSAHARQLRLEVLAQREFATPFDLSADAPLRITVLRTGPGEHLMLLVAHHIAWDDGCWEVFFTDLTRAYTGADLVPAPQPGVAAVTNTAEADLQYWLAEMADPPEPLELPGPSGSAVPTNWRSARSTLRLPAEVAHRIAALATETHATPYTVLLSAFGALVHRYSHADDFLVVTPVLNRVAGTEDAIGYYGNTIAMRLRPRSSSTFRELLTASRDTALGAFAHQGIDLDHVVRALNPDRRHGAERLTRVSFGFRRPDRHGFTPPGVRCERAEFRSRLTQLPLGFMIEYDAEPCGDGVLIEVEHLVEIIEPALAEQMLDHFAVLLDSALADPDTPLARLGLMGAATAAWLHEVSCGEQFHTVPSTLADLVSARVDLAPETVAVVYEGRHYTYREVNEAANRVAHWLIGQGIGAEDRVAVLLDKSPELVITALGVVKAGAVYLPIDPTYPQDRLSFILDDCDAKLTLREPVTDLDNYRDDDPTDADRVRPLRPENTAYLIYTSGSTGMPKGVPVPHFPVAEYFVWFQDEYRVDTDDRLLQVASPSFDVSIAEIFGTLACGARLVIHKPGGLTDIGYLTDLLRDEGITAMHFVPSLLGLFLSLPGVNQWRTLQRVPVGGEPLPGEVADKFHATFDALLHNFYGPTETVINASRYKVQGRQGTRIVPIGRPKINTQMYLLDDALRPVPVGVIGEIYIGGSHVAHGYHRRPALTAERFVADPFTPGGRLYRSGDLARRNADGDIEFVGRVDEQVKIRGFRIELADVAAAISVDPSVGQAVVLVADLPTLGKSLVGYLTPAAGGDTDSVEVERIRARVAAALPEYMVPAGYVVLDEIPITTHGKIDRAALPAPEMLSSTEFRDPESATERRLAELFGELLGRDRIGADDSFFDLGGHSLLATRLVAGVRSAFGIDVGVREVFELATVARLADRIEALVSGAEVSTRPRLIAATNDGPALLSASQLRTWFSYRLDGPSAVQNIPFAARLSGPCDTAALQIAIGDVVDRHDILRTRYREIDGVPYQMVDPPAGDGTFAVRRADGEGAGWVRDELNRECGVVFDLERDWPIRAAVLGTPDEHVLSLVVHHIAGDHWSANVLFTDLLTAYRARRGGQRPGWAPLPVQYADYAAWQAALLDENGETVGPQRDYWKRQLSGLAEEAGLRPDFPRPPVSSGLADTVEFNVDAATRDKLTALTKDLGITEFMLLQAAVAVVLHKAGGGVDVPIGAPVAGRTEPELDRLVGFFVNVLVLRNDLRDNPTLTGLLHRVREMALSAYAHQDLPFDRVVDAVRPVRTLSRNPLFQVVVHVREQGPQGRVVDSGLDGDTTFSVVEPKFDAAHADLSVNFFVAGEPHGGGYRGHLLYRPELYDRATAQRFTEWLGRVIDAFADDPDRRLANVEIVGVEQRRRILQDWSAGAGPAQVYLLDDALNPVPVGVVGDVYSSGGPLTGARWSRADVTATRLLPNPYATEPGSRFYRTDDRARWTDAGQLEFVGHADRAERRPPAAAPIRPNEPPSTDTERALAAMLAEVLDVTDVGRYDDFFTLGGDSIRAVQLAARARDGGIDLRPRLVFELPVLHDLAAALDSGAGSSDTDGDDPGDTHHAPMTASGLSADELVEVTASWAQLRGDSP